MRRLAAGSVVALVVAAAAWGIPSLATDPVQPSGQTYTVQAHDTLWEIAHVAKPGQDPRKTVAEIRALNGITAEIRPGQVIELPE